MAATTTLSTGAEVATRGRSTVEAEETSIKEGAVSQEVVDTRTETIHSEIEADSEGEVEGEAISRRNTKVMLK